VRRGRDIREVALVATTPATRSANRSLGLTQQARPKVGAEVVRIEPGSAAHRAGLTLGDVITLIADVPVPTPAQVTRSFAATGPGQRVMVAVTRGDTHFVTTVER
jgi:S1-C subfamily serine protease